MPALKKTPKHETFTKLEATVRSFSDKNACAVIAVAAATDKPYEEVHQLFLEEGRKPGKGTPDYISGRVIKLLGFKRTRVDLDEILAKYPLPHCSVLKNVTTHHPRRFPGTFPEGRFIARTRGHALAIIDGQVVDWSANSALRIVQLYKIEPMTEVEAAAKKVAKRLADELWVQLKK
jgi:hypothetical protein